MDICLNAAAVTRLMVCLCVVSPAAMAADPDTAGRDFPKTLIFDEPGIDDEISLPTLVFQPHGAPSGEETDLDVELDKRLTPRLSVQINVGYTDVSRATGPALGGWQNAAATLKFVVISNRPAEQLVSLSLTREFGGSGAQRIGADTAGSTIAAVNAGQGFAGVVAEPLLKPFAVTGSLGYQLTDRTDGASEQQALLSASLQYSFDVLMSGHPGLAVPQFMQPLLPIVECSLEEPAAGHAAHRGIVAPGLIYAGEGYQVAVEALLPLTRASGSHLGFIAQLNISLEKFGMPALARPVF